MKRLISAMSPLPAPVREDPLIAPHQRERALDEISG